MATYSAAFDTRLLTNVYDSLTTRDPSGKLIPDLATSWDSTPDFKTWTFHLRQNVKFQDGEEMTADDVAYDINAWADPKFPGGVGSQYTGVTKVTAVDKYTVQVQLKQPEPRFARNMSLFRSPIVPKSLVEKAGGFANYAKTPDTAIGAGPYQVVSWKKDEKLVLKAFKDYWGGPAGIDEVDFIPIPDASARTAALLAGDIDVEQDFPFEQLAQLKSGNAELRKALPPQHIFININAQKGPFKDLKLRQALNYAIDKEAINKNLLGGLDTLTVGFALPNEVGYDPNLKSLYSYDPDKARALVKEAGANGLNITMYVNLGSLNAKEVGDAIAGMLSDVGIKAKVQDVSSKDWAKASKAKAYDISYTTNGGGGMFSVDDPMRTVFNRDRGNPTWTGFYVNPQIEAMQDKLITTSDDNGGTDLMKQIDEILLNDAATVNMFQEPALWGVNKKLKWTPSAAGSLNMHDAAWS